jgi:hypothetical protein
MRQFPILHLYVGRFGASISNWAGLRRRRPSWSYGWLLVASLCICSATNKDKGSIRLLFQPNIYARLLTGEMTSSSRARPIPCRMSKFRCINLPVRNHPILFSQLGIVQNENSNIVGCTNRPDSLHRSLHLRTSGIVTSSMKNDAVSDATNDADWARWKTRCWVCACMNACTYARTLARTPTRTTAHSPRSPIKSIRKISTQARTHARLFADTHACTRTPHAPIHTREL